MKNIIKLITTLCLLVTISTSLVACSTYSKVNTALNNIGYTAIEQSSEADNIKEESDIAVTPHIFSNANSLNLSEIAKLNIVIVFEFNATDDMIEMYKESDTLKGFISDVNSNATAQEFYTSLVEKGYANGNCLVFSTNPISAKEVKDAIKNA